MKGTPLEIAQQNIQLRQEIAQSEKYKTLGTLASGVAHEVKNPLTVIKTFCEFLPRKLDDREFLIKFARMVSKEVDRINDLVHQLLDYGKPAPPALTETNMHKLINDTLNLFHAKFIEHRVQVNYQNNAGLSSCLLIDPNQIKQALINIILNAVEVMPAGGLLVVETSRTQAHYQITISDTGPGINPENIAHIFDPFFSTKDHSSGLGLAITQSIMESHQGRIKVKSKLHLGTEFSLILPFPKKTAE